MWPGAGYYSQEEFLCQRRHVITKYSLSRGMFNARLMHDGMSDWVLERLLGIYTLCLEDKAKCEAN
jgi:hypothetical protein